MRLVGGGAEGLEGQVQVRLSADGEWGAVCGPSLPEDAAAAAAAVCRSLGLEGGAARTGALYVPCPEAPDASPASNSAAPALVGSVRCGANATSLNECSFGAPRPPDYTCTCTYSFAMACAGAETISEVRLSGGATPREGLLEVRLPDGSWSQVEGVGAGGGFPALVACRQLGYGGGEAEVWYGAFGARHPTLPVKVTSLECDGSEATLNECSFAYSPEGVSPMAYAMACPAAA